MSGWTYTLVHVQYCTWYSTEYCTPRGVQNVNLIVLSASLPARLSGHNETVEVVAGRIRNYADCIGNAFSLLAPLAAIRRRDSWRGRSWLKSLPTVMYLAARERGAGDSTVFAAKSHCR